MPDHAKATSTPQLKNDIYPMNPLNKFHICRIPQLFLLLLTLITACSSDHALNERLDQAESLMNDHPDSSLTILQQIDVSAIQKVSDKARHSILMSMALDKNYIDTTTFDVLQPALDYYPKHGTSDEKLRTYYYAGIIYLNRKETENAMHQFLKAHDLNALISDSATYAHLLVAESIIYYNSYQYDKLISYNNTASDIYHKLHKDNYEYASLRKALEGYLILDNKEGADSVIQKINQILIKHPQWEPAYIPFKISYHNKFASPENLKTVLDSVNIETVADNYVRLDVAYGYLTLHDIALSKEWFESVDFSSPLDSMKYISLKPYILEASGDYKNALNAYREYIDFEKKHYDNMFTRKSSLAEKNHEIEITNLAAIQKKNNLINTITIFALIAIAVIGIVYYQLIIARHRKAELEVIHEKEKLELHIQNERIIAEKQKLEIENLNKKLECERQDRISENLKAKIDQLENERIMLKDLLSVKNISAPVSATIKERLGLLNSLLASKITENEFYSKSYNQWIDRITKDKENFMNDTRLAFKESHPVFMYYLEAHGLTEAEVNYTCLYALGLRGKDVGEYIQLKRHYHLSSDIRKKLGIDQHSTNLGIYIRKLMKEL